MSRSAEGFDDLSDHVAGNLVAEVERLRAEVAELRAEVERHLQDAEKILDSFDSGLFIRDISRDHESGWAMRYLKPMAAISRLRAAIDAAKGKP